MMEQPKSLAQSKTLWSTVAAVLTTLPILLAEPKVAEAMVALLGQFWVAKLLAIGTILSSLGSLFSKLAAQKAHEAAVDRGGAESTSAYGAEEAG